MGIKGADWRETSFALTFLRAVLGNVADAGHMLYGIAWHCLSLSSSRHREDVCGIGNLVVFLFPPQLFLSNA